MRSRTPARHRGRLSAVIATSEVSSAIDLVSLLGGPDRLLTETAGHVETTPAAAELDAAEPLGHRSARPSIGPGSGRSSGRRRRASVRSSQVPSTPCRSCRPSSSRTSRCDRRPGPSTRIDLTGAMFSMAAPSPAPVTIAPHLVGLIFCPPGESGSGVFEVVFRHGDGRPRGRRRRRAPGPQREPVHRRTRQVHVPPGARRTRVRRVPADLRLLPRSTRAPGTSCRSRCSHRPNSRHAAPAGPYADLR